MGDSKKKDEKVSATLALYQEVPAGFETVILDRTAKTWNLWWNTKLSDDPEVWDDEIQSINQMQQHLPKLTTEQRLIRAQMAEFCRMHPLFPRSIDILCQEIGGVSLVAALRMGCEGRGLLDCLQYHDRHVSGGQRNDLLDDCARSLQRWLADGSPENPRESKTFTFLGGRTNEKGAFVTRLLRAIGLEELSVASLKNLCEKECNNAQEAIEILDHRPFNCFQCPEASSDEGAVPGCQCCHSMLIDAGLLCAGGLRRDRSLCDEFSCFIEEYVLVYAAAVNSWLEEASPRASASLAAARYVSDLTAQKISQGVHSSLGEKDQVKEWLAACLLKTIKGNQRWHKRTELIDRFPEATSWLTRKSGYA